MHSVPTIRIRDANDEPLRGASRYVVYWMIATRRVRYNFALDRALEHCRALQKPLLIFEPLRWPIRSRSEVAQKLSLPRPLSNQPQNFSCIQRKKSLPIRRNLLELQAS